MNILLALLLLLIEPASANKLNAANAKADSSLPNCAVGKKYQFCEFYNHEIWTNFTYECQLQNGKPTLISTCFISYVSPSNKCSGEILENDCESSRL